MSPSLIVIDDGVNEKLTIVTHWFEAFATGATCIRTDAIIMTARPAIARTEPTDERTVDLSLLIFLLLLYASTCVS